MSSLSAAPPRARSSTAPAGPPRPSNAGPTNSCGGHHELPTPCLSLHLPPFTALSPSHSLPLSVSVFFTGRRRHGLKPPSTSSVRPTIRSVPRRPVPPFPVAPSPYLAPAGLPQPLLRAAMPLLELPASSERGARLGRLLARSPHEAQLPLPRPNRWPDPAQRGEDAPSPSPVHCWASQIRPASFFSSCEFRHYPGIY